MYIAKSIAEQHHGSLVATSDGIGRGATFTMTLPLWEVPEQTQKGDIHLEEAPNTISTASREPFNLRILVVDDVASNRKLLTRLLKKEGHVSDEATNGQEAIDKVKESMSNQRPYDCVLMVSVCIYRFLLARFLFSQSNSRNMIVFSELY